MRYRVSFTRLGHKHIVVVDAPSENAASINVQRAASTAMSCPRIDKVEQVHRSTPLTSDDAPAFRHGGFTAS